MRVLLATDGSKCADVAVQLARAIDWPAGSEIRLLTAIEPVEPVLTAAWAPALATDLDKQDRELELTTGAALAETAKLLARPNIVVGCDIVRGRPATAIANDARAWRADLIMVGSRGHGTIGSMLLGSVSAGVVDHAPCPVLIARGQGLNKVVLGDDGSACARVAEDLVATWPIFAGTDITVTTVAYLRLPWTPGLALSVYAIPEGHEEPVEAIVVNAKAVEDDAVKRLDAAGRKATGRVVAGDAAGELIRVATEESADVIVVGTHGRSALERVLVGGVARNVMLHAHCSVLVARRVVQPSEATQAA